MRLRRTYLQTNLQFRLRSARAALHVNAKLLVLTLLSIIAIFSICMRTVAQFGLKNVNIDTSWTLELENQLRMGHLLGRDVQFTYGPLAQALAWLASLVRSDHSALYGYGTTTSFFEIAAILLLAMSLALIPRVRWIGAVFIFAIFYLLIPIFYIRPFVPLFGMILLARALDAPLWSRRALSVLIGLLWFASQLITFDMGVFAVAASFGLLALGALFSLSPLRRWRERLNLLPARDYIETFVISFVVVLACNLLIELYYRLSSPTYVGFDYLRYAFVNIRSYSYTMGADWSLGGPETLIPFVMICYTVIGVFNLLRRGERLDAHLLIGLLGLSMLMLKSMIVRSGIGHFLFAIGPFLLLFLLVVYLSREHYTFQLVGIVLLVLVTVFWPATNLPTLRLLGRIVAGNPTVADRLHEIRHTTVDRSALAPAALQATVDSQKDLVDFPYDNIVALALGRRSFAPVLQTYAAYDTQLQTYYVHELERRRSEIEIVYGMDTIVAHQLEGVQSISRTPIIFKYIYEHFRLKSDSVFRNGFVVLAPRAQPRTMALAPIAFDAHGSGNTVDLRLRQPANCALLALDLTITYPALAMLGRPNHLTIQVRNANQTVFTSNLVAMEAGKTFSTFVYLGPSKSFFKLLGDTASPETSATFDDLQIAPETTSLFDVSPSRVSVERLGCVQQP